MKETQQPTRTETASTWQRLRQHRATSWGIDIGIIAVVFFVISAWQTRDLLGGGERPPAFALKQLDGGHVASTQLEGKKTVLVFWAPWCTVCGAESGTISSLAESVGDDTNVLSVALEYEDLQDVRGFVDEHNVDYPVLLGDRDMVKSWNISAFPTTYILDEEGKIAHSMVGFTTGFGFRWRLWLA